MYFTPTTFLAKLLAAMQVLMTLDMPLSTTMALPVTSKPIESTVENSAWQAWIELPPEQKQQVKSRKVTPKSIFTLPLRVECPDGHKQVDTKCIPIIIGTNDVLIDLNALGLLVDSTQTEDLYDYDDMSEEVTNPFSFDSLMPVGEAEKSVDGLNVELKPPSKDEPLKFNIFENKFHIFHEEPLEDYSSLSNEGLQSTEKEQTVAASLPQTTNESSTAIANVTAINDLASEASNFSENNFDFYAQQEKNFSASDSEAKESNTFTTRPHEVDFKIDAISVPAFGFGTLKQNKLSIAQNGMSINSMDTESTTTIDDRDKPRENDIQTLLQTESFLPLANQTTATTLQNENVSLTTVSLQESNESSSDSLSLNVDEEITTIPNIMEHDVEVRKKQEHTRSVTLNPIITKYSGDIGHGGDNGQAKDSTLETVTNIELLLEITTPIQLDETTIIETDSSLSFTPSRQQERKELLLQQEQTQKDFEELQIMRKGQKDQHVVLKKSKVQPVKVLFTSSNTNTAATTSANIPTAKNSADELISSIAETVTPLLTDHIENDNNTNNKNDRFYHQQLKKQNNEATQRSGSEKTSTTSATAPPPAPVSATGITATKPTEISTIPLTSEIDLAEELRLINALVKGIRPTTNKTTATTTTTTTEKPKASSTTKTISTDDIQLSSSLSSLSESSIMTKKLTPSSSQIWSKILPLLTTTSTTPMPKNSANESFDQSDQKESFSSARSNRNSKITRVNTRSFNSISAANTKTSDSTIYSTTAATTTTTSTTKLYDSTATSSSSTTSSENLKSSEESNAYDPYWWLPVAWRLDKPTTSEKQEEPEQENSSEEQSLLLRFWSAYTPKSS